MYYYIVDPPQTKADQTTVTTIRNRLVPEGLAGEFIFRTPGQSATALAERAIHQGFTTLVCVGGDALAGELAAVLYDQPVALGVIPMQASGSLHDLIGYSDWKVGIAALRSRRLVLRDLGVLNGEKCFLTEVTVRTKKPTDFHIHLNRFTATALTDHLIIKLAGVEAPFDIPGVLNFVIMGKGGSKGLFGGLFGAAAQTYDTLLRAEQAVVQTDAPAEVLYGAVSIAETPISLSIIPQAVRMIVARNGQSASDTV